MTASRRSAEVLLTPFEPLDLSHRVVMAPLTRQRNPGHAPTALSVEYYAQRASPGGLLISEGMAVSRDGVGHVDVPGLWSNALASSWKPVTDAVHARGGKLFAQLWHVGRATLAAHGDGSAAGTGPWGPSTRGVSPDGPHRAQHPVTREYVSYETPRALDGAGIARVVGAFAAAAGRAAVLGGFDGVEIHAANGYLLQQFVSDAVNDRADEYGGSVEKRARLTLDVARAAAAAVGARRVGVRLSPFTPFLEATSSDAERIYSHLVDRLSALGVAYVHFVRADAGRFSPPPPLPSLRPIRERARVPVIVCGSLTPETAAELIEGGEADLVAFGELFIANPDLVDRVRAGGPYSAADPTTYYAPKPGVHPSVGYTDYPVGGHAA